jgi:aspartyl aminopeptidase
MRIPMLAIHLYREIGEQGFKPNKQTHLAPILATAVKAAASKGAPEKASSGVESKPETPAVAAEPNGETPSSLTEHGNAAGKVCLHS